MRTIERFFEGKFGNKRLKEPYRSYWISFWKVNVGILFILIVWIATRAFQPVTDFFNYVIWGIGG